MVLDTETTILEYKRLAQRFGLVTTPLIDLSSLSSNPQVRILAKDESQNITGSVKVRAALYNLANTFDLSLERRMYLDASSGNYAKALIFFTHRLQYPCTIFVPQSFSKTTEEFMKHENITEKVISEGIHNSDNARNRAFSYVAQHPELTYLDQYNNNGSWLCHYHFTGCEIADQLTEMGLAPSHFISGIGSGGTLVGIGKLLKERCDTQIIGLESKVPHTIRGIRRLDDENTPSVYSNQKEVVDCLQEIDITEVNAFKDAYSLPYGISACANLLAALRKSSTITAGTIVTVIPDRGN